MHDSNLMHSPAHYDSRNACILAFRSTPRCDADESPVEEWGSFEGPLEGGFDLGASCRLIQAPSATGPPRLHTLLATSGTSGVLVCDALR